MNKSNYTTLAVLLAIGAAGLTGCFSDSGNNSDDSGVLTGRLQGDANLGPASASAWAGASVTTHTLSTDGTLSASVDSVTTENDGTFTISGTGHKEWILLARRADTVWMTRFEGTLVKGKTVKARPLNLQTSVEAAVWMELKKTSEGREVLVSEIDLAIDGSVAASARTEYRGNSVVRNSLIARLASSVQAASRARHTYLTLADSVYTSKRASVDSARSAAYDSLSSALVAATADTAAIHAAERAYLNANVNAYLKAGVGRVAYARSSEASYHALLRNSDFVAMLDSARTSVARNYARVLAVASDTAMRSEFRAAGSSVARSQLVATAGTTFQTSVETAPSRAQLDSAVTRYRSNVRIAFNSVTDTGFTLFKTVVAEVGMVTMTDSLSLSLANLVNASTSGESVGTAYASAQTSAQSRLRTRIEAVNTDDTQARAAAYISAFLAVRAALN